MHNFWKVFLKEEEAFALITVLLFSVILLLLGSALLSDALTERTIASYHREEVDLYYSAEGGIEAGRAALQEDFLYNGALSYSLDDDRHFEVTFANVSPGRRRIKSVSPAEDYHYTLTAVAEFADPYHTVLLATEKMNLEDVHIQGNFHVNDALQVKGSNTLAETEEENIDFSYHNAYGLKFTTPETEFLVGEDRYRNPHDLMEDAVETLPLTLPEVASVKHKHEMDCLLSGNPSGGGNRYRFPVDLPPCYQPGVHMRVDGHLILQPEAGETLHLDGFFFIEGDLEVELTENSEVELEGVFLVEGKTKLSGKINREAGGSPWAILSQENIRITDVQNEAPLLGGRALLYTEKDLHMPPLEQRKTQPSSQTSQTPLNQKSADSQKDPLKLDGALMARRLHLSHFHLHYDPGLIQKYGDYLPGFGVEITEWSPPHE